MKDTFMASFSKIKVFPLAAQEHSLKHYLSECGEHIPGAVLLGFIRL